ncbi:phage major tail tube protein [Vibrio brasiliensis]|uniref:phage major tail tube protein n=1 Tax=Vibrio brasiliensis TaxID=170652 RepID=UPI001EFC516C|nr:phage major tail tube protein [Vibrio brasiliensis]MCG9785386.1 phage major tail tube protein [Vibrio brasiliensis]
MTMTSIRRRKAVTGGVKVTNNIESFTQPAFVKTYTDVPGSFVGSKEHMGFEASEWKLVIKGEKADVMLGAMLKGDKSVLIYTESGKHGTEDFTSEHIMTGDIAREYSESKNGEPQTLTLTGQIKDYKWTQNGKVITNVNIENGDYFIDGVTY